MIQVKTIKYKEIVEASSNMHIVRFYKPEEFEYQAGQFLTITIEIDGEKLYRCYSISSHPDEEYIEFTVKFPEHSRARKYLESINDGDELPFIGPSGKYVFHNNDLEKVHIVTGAGIGPNYSMLKEWDKQGARQKSYLFFGAGFLDSIPYMDQFEEWKDMKGFEFYPCLTREEGDGKNTFSGRVLNVFPNIMTDLSNKEFYICGKPDMVKETVEMLISLEVDQERIHHEEFTYAYK